MPEMRRTLHQAEDAAPVTIIITKDRNPLRHAISPEGNPASACLVRNQSVFDGSGINDLMVDREMPLAIRYGTSRPAAPVQ